MKGIILAGGAGSRLYPNTQVITKQLLPVYDKPMIYYPLATLMLAGIKEILIITTPTDVGMFNNLLGNGSHLGINISYMVQEEPKGIAEALIIAEDYIGFNNVALILGDNIFYGQGLPILLRNATMLKTGAIIFGYWVKDPERYGVISLDSDGNTVKLEEKPENPGSNYAIPGLYFYDNRVVDIAKNITPSARGELEITAVNKEYLSKGKLKVQIIGRGSAWLDTGTPESLLDASNFIATIEKRQGLKIACIEEVAYRMGYINDDEVKRILNSMPDSSYKNYLESMAIVR